MLDPDGFVISAADGFQTFPTIAASGTISLVAWSDARGGRDNVDIYGARVTPGGTVLDPDGLCVSAAIRDQVTPAVAFDDTNYLVVGQDYRGGRTPTSMVRAFPRTVQYSTLRGSSCPMRQAYSPPQPSVRAAATCSWYRKTDAVLHLTSMVRALLPRARFWTHQE